MLLLLEYGKNNLVKVFVEALPTIYESTRDYLNFINHLIMCFFGSEAAKAKLNKPEILNHIVHEIGVCFQHKKSKKKREICLVAFGNPN